MRKYRRTRRGTEPRPTSFSVPRWLAWDGQRLESLLIFRIHGFGAAAHRRFRKTVLAGIIVEPGIGARKMMRDPADGMVNLAARHAILRSRRVAGVQNPVRRANQGLAQENRIFDDGHHCQIVAMTNEVFRHLSFLTAWKPIAAEPALFEMRGLHLQHVADPLA